MYSTESLDRFKRLYNPSHNYLPFKKTVQHSVTHKAHVCIKLSHTDYAPSVGIKAYKNGEQNS